MFRLDGQRVLITGGTSGIGLATAGVMLRAGARVMIASRGRTSAAQAVETLSADGDVHYHQADVGDEASVRGLMDAAASTLGGLDVLINNAAVINRTPLVEMELEQWEDVIRNNLTGVYLCSRHALPHLRAARGVIVNVASYLAFRSGAGNTAAYNAAKAGIVAVTRTLAVAHGPEGVRVNAVCPGFVPTPLNRTIWEGYMTEDWTRAAAAYPLQRLGTPEDVAYAVLFLSSKEAGWITGAALLVDGGLTAR